MNISMFGGSQRCCHGNLRKVMRNSWILFAASPRRPLLPLQNYGFRGDCVITLKHNFTTIQLNWILCSLLGSWRCRGSGEAGCVLTSHLSPGAAACQIPTQHVDQARSGRWDPYKPQGQQRGLVGIWWVLVHGAQCTGTGSGLCFVGKGFNRWTVWVGRVF